MYHIPIAIWQPVSLSLMHNESMVMTPNVHAEQINSFNKQKYLITMIYVEQYADF